MGELSPNTVYVASARAESPAPIKESKIVRKAKEVLNKWWERVGPKQVEDHFIKAHERVLGTIKDADRIKAYEQTADRWRTWGKALGIASTVIDTGLSAVGFGLSVSGLKNPSMAAQGYLDIVQKSLELSLHDNPNMTPGAVLERINQRYISYPDIQADTTASSLIQGLQLNPEMKGQLGRNMALIPGIYSTITTLGTGPTHLFSHLVATIAEAGGKMKARTHNYIDSGNAAKHAKAVGKTLGEAAQWAAEHPDEIRKTVDTVSRVKRKNDESKQKIAQARQKAADAALETEYQDWISHHPDKTYYEQSGFPYPSKAEYVQMKKEEELKRKKNLEAEKRGMA